MHNSTLPEAESALAETKEIPASVSAEAGAPVPTTSSPESVAVAGQATRFEYFYRHRFPTRVWHWLNALCVFILLGSGFNILAAHPALYWGHSGNVHDQPWLSISSQNTASGPRGVVRVAGLG